MGDVHRLRTGEELNSPYGGTLVNLHVPPGRATELKSISRDLISIDLSPRQLADLELLATGVFHRSSPSWVRPTTRPSAPACVSPTADSGRSR